jgi:[acyl-carrier-protein] S-malonyltransferase
VRWVDTVRCFLGQGVTHIIECGPGRVLAGINKRIAGNLQQYALADAATVNAALAAIR